MTETPMTERRRRMPPAWRRRGFRQLTGAWLFTNLADSALYLMMAVWVKDLTGSDAAAAIVFAMLGLAALSAPFLGQLADRVSRKRLLVVANLVMVPVVLGLLLVGSAAQLGLVYVIIGLYGCVGYLTAAAQSGLIRDLLPDEELASGNGMLSTIDQVLRLASPILGTALYVAFGPASVIVLTAVCFAVTAVVLARLEVAESPPAPAAPGHYWRELGAGFGHLFRTSPLGALTVAIAVGFGATGLINVAIFPVMEQGLGVPAAMLGVLVTLQGVGAVVGGLLSARLVGRLGERGAIALGMVVLALGLVALVSSELAVVIAGMVVGGFSIPVIIVAYSTLRQRMTPAQLQGRTAAAANLSLNGPQTLAMLGGAALLGIVDYRWLIVATAVVVGVSALLALRGRGSAPSDSR